MKHLALLLTLVSVPVSSFTFLSPVASTLKRQGPARTSENIFRKRSVGEGYRLSSSALSESSNAEISVSELASIKVSTLSNESSELGSFLESSGKTTTTVLSCLSHFGDFNAWEVAQQYITAIDLGDFDDCNILLVGIGSSASAAKFAEDVGLEQAKRIRLLADERGAVTEALGCYRGWLAVDKAHAAKWPATDVNPYVKLLGMIFGFGSPGTIERVVYGYVGDKSGGMRSRRWVVDSILFGTEKGRFPQIAAEAFDGIPEESGLRPFELATLRAQNGIHIVLNWGKLGPEDGDLFTRMGGTFVFRGEECIYKHFDKGILTYAPMEEVSAATKKSQE